MLLKKNWKFKNENADASVNCAIIYINGILEKNTVSFLTKDLFKKLNSVYFIIIGCTQIFFYFLHNLYSIFRSYFNLIYTLTNLKMCKTMTPKLYVYIENNNATGDCSLFLCIFKIILPFVCYSKILFLLITFICTF